MEQVPLRKVGVKVKRKLNWKGILKLIVFIVAFCYFGFLAVNFAISRINQQLIRVEPLKIGVLKDSVPARGILVKDELLVNSQYKGKVKYVAQEGDRIRVGDPVANIVVTDINSPSGQRNISINASVPGIIDYSTDDLENIFNVNNTDNVFSQDPNNVKLKPREIKNDSTIENGGLVFKIVNNLARDQIYLRVPTQSFPGDMLKKNNLLEVNFEQKNVDSMIFEIDQIKTSGKYSYLILGNNSFVPQWLGKREVKVQLTRDTYNGGIIPTKALVKKNGQKGIYIQYKDEVVWKEVKVLGTVKDKTVITGVEEETPYIVNPQYAQEGETIY